MLLSSTKHPGLWSRPPASSARRLAVQPALQPTLPRRVCVSASPQEGDSSPAAPRRRGRKPGTKVLLTPKPLDLAVEAFLRGKGVDTAALVAALPQRASQLGLGSVADTWRLLEDHGVLNIPALLRKAPAWLSADAEANLRPKLQLLGLRGEPLVRLLATDKLLPYTSAEQLEGLLARLQHYIGAAVAAGLLPQGTSMRQLIAKKPGLWAPSLKLSAGKADAAFAALQDSLALSKAEFGAAVADFPGLFAYSTADLQRKCAAVVELVGSRQAAAEVVVGAPLVLFSSEATFRANVAYLQRDLGWSLPQIAAFAKEHVGTFSRGLTAPAMQHVLRQCEAVLDLSPSTVLEQHASSLRCSPEAAVVRLAFVAEQRLQPKPRFLKDSPKEWASRLHRWGLGGEWAAFRDAYWESEEGAALQQQMAAARAEKAAAAAAAKSASCAAAWAAGRNKGNTKSQKNRGS